jgi:hypothetical protein
VGPARIPAAIRPMPGILDTLRDINARLANIEAHMGIRKTADPSAAAAAEEPGSETPGGDSGTEPE